MARIRTIKPDFPQSESMGRLSRESRLFFILLWTIADDSGRTRGNSRILASLLYPYDDDAVTLVDTWICELEGEGCIRRYVIGGSTYIEICNWLKHQKIDKPTQSKIPPFDESSRILANPPDKFAGEGIGRERKGEEGRGAEASPQLANPQLEGTDAGLVCARLKSSGIAMVNPQHPKLLALLSAGLTVDEIAAIGPEAREKEKGFQWILSVAEGRRREAANIKPMPARAESLEARNLQAVKDWVPPEMRGGN